MGKILIAKEAAEKALVAELSRAESLARDAWKFVAGISLVMAFQLRDLRTLVESPSAGVKLAGCVSLAVLAIALFLAFYSFQFKSCGHYPRGNKLWDTLKPDAVSDQEAEEAMVQMLLQTREQHARLNDSKRRVLGWCGWIFFAGLLLVAGSQLLDAFADWT
jgi:hypothetical protein